MVALGRELVSYHRLSIQTTLVSGTGRLAAICYAIFDWGLPIPSSGEGVVVYMGSKMCPLGPCVARVRLPNYRSISHRFPSAPGGPNGQTDRRTELVYNRRRYALKCIGRQKRL